MQTNSGITSLDRINKKECPRTVLNIRWGVGRKKKNKGELFSSKEQLERKKRTGQAMNRGPGQSRVKTSITGGGKGGLSVVRKLN